MIIKLRSAELKERTIVLFDGDDDAGGKWKRGGVRLRWREGIAVVVV